MKTHKYIFPGEETQGGVQIFPSSFSPSIPLTVRGRMSPVGTSGSERLGTFVAQGVGAAAVVR